MGSTYIYNPHLNIFAILFVFLKRKILGMFEGFFSCYSSWPQCSSLILVCLL